MARRTVRKKASTKPPSPIAVAVAVVITLALFGGVAAGGIALWNSTKTTDAITQPFDASSGATTSISQPSEVAATPTQPAATIAASPDQPAPAANGQPIMPPGAFNASVTQATIGQTICVSGWTATVRPPTSYTGTLKRQQMAAEQLSGTPADYEEDHFIPLELGGSPTSPDNLWPEPYAGPWAARSKDAEETRLKEEVCAGTITLAQGRAEIRDPANWH
ncbi:MAG: hypothetical protein ACYDA6_00025 [Solirubrobacteraceae bacterium]